MNAVLLAMLVLLSTFASPCGATASEDVWVLVDTSTLTLSVMRGDALVQQYANIAIGSNGPTWDKQKSDEKTPLGDFRISGINTDSRFHLFLAFDYPTMEHGLRALQGGRLGAEEYAALSVAWASGLPPPQETRLGGYLGIHGIGRGSPEIHGSFNWTDGCIAVTNEQMDELAGWVGVGTRVSVR